ncbi:hypothetical protein BG004_004909 [Podila humilis]|nr:hypothetical protein BG004_004909 [Podila humilis]
MQNLRLDNGQDEDDGDDEEGRNPSASLMIEDPSPPLQWKESDRGFASDSIRLGQDVSPIRSSRFSMDAIAGGAFAMPSSPPSLLPESTVNGQPGPTPASDPIKAEVKKRRWQSPKTAKGLEASALSSLVSANNVTEFGSTTADQSPSLFDAPIGTSTPISEKSPTVGTYGNGTTAQGEHNNKKPPHKKNTFSLEALANSGIVSGLASLKNSIMIPALPPSSTKLPSGRSSPVLSLSQNSLIEFAKEHRIDAPSGSSSIAASPSMFRSSYLSQPGGQYSTRGSGASSVILGDHYSDSSQPALRLQDRPESFKSYDSPKNRWPTFGVAPGHQSPTGNRHRHRTMNQNTAAQSLSALELEFQHLVQRQSVLSSKKVLFKQELQQLYSKCHKYEGQQENAAGAEDFGQADSAAKALQLVQGRIQYQEKEVSLIDKSLWEAKKKQDELGRSISALHEAVMQEMVMMKQARERNLSDFKQAALLSQKSEMERIQADRQQLEKTRSDLVLEQDFLGKNESELCERMEEETKQEQAELDVLMDKRKSTRLEIIELTKKLETLQEEDKEFSHKIEVVQQKIRSITQQFDTQAQGVSRERLHFDRMLQHSIQQTEQLDRREAKVQERMDEAKQTQSEIAAEIETIELQQKKLEEVRQQFSTELDLIQQLHLEEERFKESEAAWSLQAVNWQEELRRIESRIQELAAVCAADQQLMTEKEIEIEALEKKIRKEETSKTLAVQSRSFKKAAVCSHEVTRMKELLLLRKAELETLQEKVAKGKTEVPDEIDVLQSEFNDRTKSINNDAKVLSVEIQQVVKDTLQRLDNIFEEAVNPNRKDDSLEDGVQQESRAIGTAGGSMLMANKSKTDDEPKDALDVSRSMQHDTDERRRTFERDIQAAVAKEDYETADSLQQRLNKIAKS